MTCAKCGRRSQWFRRSRHAILVAGLVSVQSIPEALADDGLARSGARETARSGVEAYEQKRYADALDLLTRAESVMHAPTHLLYIARSAAALHRLILARETYLKLTHEQLAPNASSAFRSAQKAAADELAALEPRIPTLKLQVHGSPNTEAEVSLDDQVLPKALIGTSIPIDPGRHVLKASGPKVKPVEVEVTVAESSEQVAVLKLEPAAEPIAAVAAPPGPVQPPPPAPEPKRTNYLRIGSYAAAGVGLVGIGAGTYFAFRAKSKGSDADSLYTSNGCPSGARCTAGIRSETTDLDDSAASAKTMSAVGFITGGVGIAAAVTLFVLSSRQTEAQSASTTVMPYAGPGNVGVLGWF